MDVSILRLQNYKQVNAKCDKNIKGYAEDKCAGKINFMCHGENTVQNHKTPKMTTNWMKENKNENTETENKASAMSGVYWLYAEATKNGLTEKQ